MTKPLDDLCAQTGKRCFHSPVAAKRARKRYRQKRHGASERSVRSYECPFCGYWHNTSKPVWQDGEA